MKSQKRSVRPTAFNALLAITLIMTLAGCAGTVSIRDLLAEPQRYSGQEVQVKGRVTRSAGILGVGAYELDDGTGQILVVSQGGGVPSQGSDTKVKGKFESVFNWGGRSIAAILQGQRAP